MREGNTLRVLKLTKERGATAVEYSVLVAVLCVGLLSALAGMRQGMFGEAESQLMVVLRDPAGFSQNPPPGLDNPSAGGGTEVGRP